MRITRAWMVYDTHQVELPNHKQALENLDFTNARLRVLAIEEGCSALAAPAAPKL